MDKSVVMKIQTFKSGHFVFSHKYDHSELNGYIYATRLLYDTITALPVLPEWSSRFEEEIVRRSIFGTAALEGNPLNEDEVNGILDSDQKNASLRQADQEIANLKIMYDVIRKQEPHESPFLLDEKFIRDVHEIITQDIDYTANIPGNYRNHKVQVGNRDHGGVYTPPKCLPDIEKLMSKFCEWINSEPAIALDPFLRASLAHYHIGLIHPFGDGNGRTARVIEAILLRTSNIKFIPTMLSNFYYHHMDDYFWAFSLPRKNKTHDVTPFLKFTLEGVIDSLNEIKEGMTGHLKRLLMRDYVALLKEKKEITQRQADLIQTLLYAKPITLKDLFITPPYNVLYRSVSERTARRDVAKLVEKGLFKEENGTYRLNFEYFS